MRVLIEGRPGSGKTTAASRLAHLLGERNIEVQGFVTDEVRESGTRVGFTVRSFSGEAATLAHVDLPGPPRVGKYGVDLAAFEQVALASLAAPPKPGVVVLDELGKMELASQPFRDAVRQLFETSADIVATVHVFRHELTDELKRRSDVELVRVTKATRDDLPRLLADRLQT